MMVLDKDKDFVKALAIESVKAGLKANEFAAYLETLETLFSLASERQSADTEEDDEPEVTITRPVIMRAGALRRGEQVFNLPLKVKLLMLALAENVGKPCTQESLAAAMKSPKTSVAPTVSSARKTLAAAGLPGTEIILTIPAEGEAQYQWSDKWVLVQQ